MKVNQVANQMAEEKHLSEEPPAPTGGQEKNTLFKCAELTLELWNGKKFRSAHYWDSELEPPPVPELDPVTAHALSSIGEALDVLSQCRQKAPEQ